MLLDKVWASVAFLKRPCSGNLRTKKNNFKFKGLKQVIKICETKYIFKPNETILCDETIIVMEVTKIVCFKLLNFLSYCETYITVKV